MSSKDPRYIKLVSCSKWRNLRNWYIGQHPLCEKCKVEGRSTLATTVHHIDPVEDCMNLNEMQRRCYNPANLMSLCKECHIKIHQGYHTKQAVALRNKQRASRSIMLLQGYDETSYQMKKEEKRNNIPTWEPPK